MTETGIHGIDSWIYRHREGLKYGLRILFGFIWTIDGSLKFQAGFVDQFAGSISPDGQPGWLQG